MRLNCRYTLKNCQIVYMSKLIGISPWGVQQQNDKIINDKEFKWQGDEIAVEIT